MKQTAVQWLLQRFEDGDMYNVEDVQFIKHQALAMEREQIVDANISGMEFIPVDPSKYKQDAKQYYNETYGGNNES
jgi:hypothetical protein